MASKIDVTVSEKEPNSCLERASTLVSSKILPISKWLLYVTANIAPREIALLKLCLHRTLVRDTSEASTASDLFRAMDGSDDLEQQQAVLYKFICALRVIGCKRRGEECIAQLKRMEIEVPEASDHEESYEFRFFQCFARVARDIESDDDARDKIKEAFSRRLKKNHHHYDHCAIADLFTDIYKAGLVRPDDCQEFLQVLNRCKKQSKYSYIMGKCEVETENMWELEASSRPSSLETQAHDNISTSEAYIPATPSTLRVAPVCKIVAAVILVSLSLLILLTGIPTTIFFAVECLHATQPDIHNVGAHEGNVMIVTEVYPALTSKFIVEENVLHGDWPHPIHLYLAESCCEQLPTLSMEKLYSNTSTLKNITTVYLLPGSSIDYNFSASTLGSVQETIEVYIVKGIQNIQKFNPDNDGNFPYSRRFVVGPQQTSICIRYVVTSQSQDYYTLLIFLPTHVSMNLSYNATVLIVAIDLQQLLYEYSHNISGDNEEWQHALGKERCSHKKCLIADIEVSGNQKITHLSVQFSLRLFMNVGFVQLLFSVAGLFCLILVFVIMLVVYFRKTIKDWCRNKVNESKYILMRSIHTS